MLLFPARTISLSPHDAQRIWQPNLYWERLREATSSTPTDASGESVMVYVDGHVWRSQQMSVTLGCPLSHRATPTDQTTPTELQQTFPLW